MPKDKFFKIAALTFCGFLGSILVGIIFYNTQIFIPILAKFQFVVFGLYGASFYSLLKYGSKKDQLFGIVFIILMQFTLIGKSLSFALIIRDVIYLTALLLSIKTYHHFIRIDKRIKYYFRGLALAFIYALFTILFGSLVYIINARLEFPPSGFLLSISKLAMLVGLGIGIGLDFYFQNEEKIIRLLRLF